MKNTLRQIFHSPKFVVGFGIFVFILLIMLIYPMFNPGNPLEMIGVGTFASPGTYVSRGHRHRDAAPFRRGR